MVTMHYPATDGSTAEAVARTLGVSYEPWMQDWPIEVANGDRVAEFLSRYEKEEKPAHRLAIAELIVASLDDAIAIAKAPQSLLDRAGPILKTYPHIIEYWSRPDAQTNDEMFHVTPWI